MTDKELLKKAGEHIQLLEAELERLVAPPHSIATVLDHVSDTLVLVSGDKIVDVPKGKKAKAFPVGSLALVNAGGAIVDSIDLSLAGVEVTVKRLISDKQMEVESSGGAVVVFKGLTADCVKPGDTVQLDRTGSIAMRILPKDRSAYSVETATGICWDDIGGQDEAKAALQEAVEGPISHAALFKAYGKAPLKGALLSGPPGCGKTLLAKATANAIRQAHKASEAGTAFIYVKGPEVLNMWVGNTEAQIRGLFARAKEHKTEYGYPAVVFIDEADAILGKRGSHHSSILSQTIVPTFLAEMDGMQDSGAFVLLATNRPDTLDPAIVREGRIDRKVVVGRPAMRETAQILRIHLGKTKVKDDVDTLAGQAAADLFSDSHVLYRVSIKGKGTQVFHIRHLMSGAMLAGVVDMATSIAIQRDSKTGKASGLVVEDLSQAVAQVVRANKGLNHDDDLIDFANQHGGEIDTVQRMAA